MRMHPYRRIETVTGPRGITATIYVAMSGKSARIEVSEPSVLGGTRRVDTRRCSPARASERAPNGLASR
ncbi:MAG: hypothetical protein ACREUG_17045 [Steroidobacteraceae bacterium]